MSRTGSGRRGPQRVTPEFVMIDRADDLAALVDRLARHPEIALDTEFHRERTYRPRLALLQVASPDEVALIDPLAVDVKAIAPLLDGEPLLVMHAAGQDLEVLEHTVGVVPPRIFDTQVAAGFIGMASPSLSSLHERLLAIHLPKADRLTDWLDRPLGQAQLVYAASDVAHLLEVKSLLVADIERRGRSEWVDTEHADLVERLHNPRDPDEAWTRIKELRQLKGEARAAAQAVAGWRERRASELDIPVRHVMSDMAVIGLAQGRPKDEVALSRIRGLDGRSLRPAVRDDLLHAIATATYRPPDVEPSTSHDAERTRRLRPAATLLSAWLSQRARELDLDPALLGTRTDIEQLLEGDPRSRMASGWRAEVVGSAITRLLEGEAALAFDGDGGLVLEERSHRRL